MTTAAALRGSTLSAEALVRGLLARMPVVPAHAQAFSGWRRDQSFGNLVGIPVEEAAQVCRDYGFDPAQRVEPLKQTR